MKKPFNKLSQVCGEQLPKTTDLKDQFPDTGSMQGRLSIGRFALISSLVLFTGISSVACSSESSKRATESTNPAPATVKNKVPVFNRDASIGETFDTVTTVVPEAAVKASRKLDELNGSRERLKPTKIDPEFTPTKIHEKPIAPTKATQEAKFNAACKDPEESTLMTSDILDTCPITKK